MKKTEILRALLRNILALAFFLAPLLAREAPQPAASAEQNQHGLNPLRLSVPVAPVPVKGNGKFHLAYELHIKNLSFSPVELRSVEVLGNHAPLAQYAGNELADKVFFPIPSSMPLPRLRLPAGQQAIVFL